MTIQTILYLVPTIQVGIVVAAIAFVGYQLISCAVSRLLGKNCA